jgi:hypothetical protein
MEQATETVQVFWKEMHNGGQYWNYKYKLCSISKVPYVIKIKSAVVTMSNAAHLFHWSSGSQNVLCGSQETCDQLSGVCGYISVIAPLNLTFFLIKEIMIC